MRIGKNYKIESDSLNIILFKRKVSKKANKEYWTVIGYFSRIQNALRGLVDLKLRETELQDIKTIVEKQDDIYRLIESLKVKE